MGCFGRLFHKIGKKAEKKAEKLANKVEETMDRALEPMFMSSIVESFLDNLQEDELNALACKKWALGNWHGKDVFGYDFSRNNDFRKMRDYLKPIYEQAFKEAHLASSGELLEDFVNKNLAHLVMQCLLYPGCNTNNYEYVLPSKHIPFFTFPKFPDEAINAFIQKWAVDSKGKVISLDTKNEGEQNFLSAKLANEISQILHNQINVKQFIVNSIRVYNNQKQNEKQAYTSVFANSSNAQELMNGRKGVTDKEALIDQLNDLKQGWYQATRRR